MKRLNVLIVCEESQTVCKEFRLLGHRAFSCDLQKCSGGFPEWHISEDCTRLLNGYCDFTTTDGKKHYQRRPWDLIIAHPPCTYLTKAGAQLMFPGGQLNEQRFGEAMKARELFMKILQAECHYIAIENPVPMKVCKLPKPTTFIEPYEFGHPYSKKTLLWLKNLPPLFPTVICPEYVSYTKKKRLAKTRSKTFQGIAKAMAEQWSEFIERSEPLGCP